jgi:phage terminase large subunit-like protein
MSAESFRPTPHPVLRLPTVQEAVRMGAQKWAEAMARREEIIRAERADPLRSGFEPPVWLLCDCLLGFPWVNPDLARRVRERLGFGRPVRSLLIQGGNRAGKSQYAANRVMRLLLGGRPNQTAAVRAWALHSTLQMSRDYQQPLFWQYMPPALRGKDIKSRDTYIAYKQKTGFSEEKFVLPPRAPGEPGADLLFKAYEQDRSGIEGGNLDIVWPDELVPVDWIETLELRVAEKNGWCLTTFTPVAGYTATVQLFLSGAEVVLESLARLLPKDGGAPDLAGQLGLTEAELQECYAAAREGRASYAPQCVPEELLNTDAEGNTDTHGPARTGTSSNSVGCGGVAGAGSLALADGPRPDGAPGGRIFEKVPRVLKCAGNDGQRAVVFFYTSDNPYGNPKSVWEMMQGKPEAWIKERWYGIATKQQIARFPKFSRDVHVIAPDQVPKEGTNYHYADPSSGRNFFMLWFRVTPEHVYVYREWPGPYYIEGVGVPGPWAEPDGKKPDGRMGPAQQTFGWGLKQYKKQIAELEGWAPGGDTDKHGRTRTNTNGKADGGQIAERQAKGNEGKPVEEWDESLVPGRERIRERSLDSRFASNPKMDNDRPTTLLTDFEDILLFFKPTPGGPISEGIQKINDLLNYDPEKPVDFFNSPRLLISSDCPNLIFALSTWTGKDGEKGATKDPIDCLHYFAVDDCPYVGEEPEEEEGQEEGNYY